MGFKIVFAPQAIEQLEQIVCYIAQDKPTAAEKFGLRLVQQTALLADFPEIGRLTSKERTFAASSVNPIGFIIVCSARSKSLK